MILLLGFNNSPLAIVGKPDSDLRVTSTNIHYDVMQQYLNSLIHSVQVSGQITYNGCELREFVPQRTAAYISQNDLQVGEMIVPKMPEFCSRCQGLRFKCGVSTTMESHYLSSRFNNLKLIMIQASAFHSLF